MVFESLSLANGLPYFQTYEDSITDLYALITTVNFPDIMMPAYNINWIFSIFFVSFLIIHLYIFTNIILATIIQNYKKHLREDVKETIKMRRAKAKEAFELLEDILSELIQKNPIVYNFKTTELVDSPDVAVVTYEKFSSFIKLIYPKIIEEHINAIYHILDSDGNNLLSNFFIKITCKNFADIP